jgi:hypothetical protein
VTEPTPTREHSGPPREQHASRGIRPVILGSVLAALAPLAGFLGGSIVGDSGADGGLSPLFLWLFGGLLVGAVGAVVAIMGGLRWVRTRHAQQVPTDESG